MDDQPTINEQPYLVREDSSDLPTINEQPYLVRTEGGGGGGGDVNVDNITLQKSSNTLSFKVKTASDKDKVWKVKTDGTWNLTNIKEWKSVNTFEGETGNDYTLYILTTDITISGVKYQKGFYTWTNADGFVMRSGASEVFTDIDVDETLPTTDINDMTLYRKAFYVYKHNNEKLENEPNGYKILDTENITVSSTSITIDTVETSWADLTSTIVSGLVEGDRLEASNYTDADFFNYDTILYDIATNFNREVAYSLYHNPTATAGGFIQIVDTDNTTIDINASGKLQVKDEGITNDKLATSIKIGSLQNVKTNTDTSVVGAINELGFVDVQTLPTSGISKYSIYRIIEYVYTHNRDEVEFVEGYSITDSEYVSVSATGITIDGVETSWGGVTQAQITELETNEKITTATYEDSAFCSFRYDNTLYFDIKSAIIKTPVYNLYHNPTETNGEYIKINGGGGSSTEIKIDGTTITLNSSNELQATAIIDVDTLPVSGIIAGVYYRRVETTPVRMVKIYVYDVIQGWINLSKIFISQANYNLLTTAQKNDGTLYVVDGLSEVLVDFTYTTISNKPSINGITLLGNLSLLDLNLYSRTEVDQLLANKGSAEFVEYVPASPVALTWYYSTHFVDQSVVPDSKRALYILDKNDVLQYMGVVGDVDLTAYYTKTEMDTLLALHYTKTESDEKFQEKLSNDTDYSTVTDSDTVANVDLSTKKVKKTAFSTVWNYIKGKITEVYYPVGTVIFNTGTNPGTAFGGTWELYATGTKALYLDSTAETAISEELPNIKGSINEPHLYIGTGAGSGALKNYTTGTCRWGERSGGPYGYGLSFDASRSSSVYKNNGKVRAEGITICAWKRTA